MKKGEKKKRILTMTAAEIKAIRLRLGLTQNQLSQMLGVHPITVCRWENKIYYPTAYQKAILERLSKAPADGKAQELLITKGALATLASLL